MGREGSLNTHVVRKLRFFACTGALADVQVGSETRTASFLQAHEFETKVVVLGEGT